MLGADPSGEPSLTYSWSATTLLNGATPPTFLVNGSNAAKNITAIFSTAGTYGFTVTIMDTAGLTATSSVSVTVNQTLTTISLAGQPLAATAFDQFGNALALANQPVFDAGSDTITSPLALASNVTICPAADSQSTICGGISGTGMLTINGPGGTVVLTNMNTYSGGTQVSAGTLVVSGASAIAADTSLMIGAGGAFIFDPSNTAGPDDTAAATTAAAVAAVAAAANVAALPVSGTTSAAPATIVVPTASASLSASADDSSLRSSASVATPPVAAPRQASLRGSQTNSVQGPRATLQDKRIGLVLGPNSPTIAADLAWLQAAASSSDSSDLRLKKDAAIQALDAVFAQYGQ